MSRGLLLSTLGTVALSASLESIADGGTAVPPGGVLAGIALAGFGLAALGAGAPQLADGLTALLLITALWRLPWELLTNALARIRGATATATTTPANAR